MPGGVCPTAYPTAQENVCIVISKLHVVGQGDLSQGFPQCPFSLNVSCLLPVGLDQSPDMKCAPTFVSRGVTKLCKTRQDCMMGPTVLLISILHIQLHVISCHSHYYSYAALLTEVLTNNTYFYEC